MISLYAWYETIRNYFTKGATLEITNKQPITDEDIERIDIDFARKTRETIRWLSANNTDVSSVIQANKIGIIGSTVNIQSRLLGQVETNQAIEDAIAEFSEADKNGMGNCEVSGRWVLDEAWRSMVEFTDKDGGFLIRHHFNTAWSIPYRFELIEIGMIDVSVDNDKDILNGLKKDKFGRVTGIYIFKDQERKDSSLVSMDELIFYSPVWISISQYTAVSKLASILPTIDKLDQYSDAELQAAIERAKAGKYWRTTMYDDIMKIVKKTSDDEVRKSQLNTLMKRISDQAVKPAGLTPIPYSDEVVIGDKQSDSIYGSLTDNAQLKIASANGMSSQIVYQDPSKSNYSAIKAMLALNGIHWSIEFNNLKAKVMMPIMRNVISASVSSGRLKIAGYFANPRDFMKLEFMRVSEIDIEPSKTANANKINLENGTHSQREMAAKRGRNVEDVQREMIEDEISEIKMREMLYKEAGIELPKPIEENPPQEDE